MRGLKIFTVAPFFLDFFEIAGVLNLSFSVAFISYI